jgi:hypothetical protein
MSKIGDNAFYSKSLRGNISPCEGTMCDPCSVQPYKCKFGNMHIRFGDFNLFIHDSILIHPPRLITVIENLMFSLTYMYMYHGKHRILLKSVEREFLS